MYIGIAKEAGKRVLEEDAFGYAMERCTDDTAEEFLKEFADDLKNLNTVEDLQKFRADVVEWFYSGNWIKEDKDEIAV